MGVCAYCGIRRDGGQIDQTVNGVNRNFCNFDCLNAYKAKFAQSSGGSGGSVIDSNAGSSGESGSSGPGFISTAISNWIDEMKEDARREKQERLNKKYNQLFAVSFDGEKNTIKGIDTLFKIYKSVSETSSEFDIDDRQDVADIALGKIEEGINKLRTFEGVSISSVDDFLIKFQKAKVNRLELLTTGQSLAKEFDFSSGPELKKNWIILGSVSFAGSEKLIVKMLESIYKALNDISKSMAKHDKKIEFSDAGFKLYRKGIAELQKRGYPQKKISDLENDMKKVEKRYEDLRIAEKKFADEKQEIKNVFGSMFGKK